MTVRILLDTNICIYVLSGRLPEVTQRLHSEYIGDVGMSAVTLGELHAGLRAGSSDAARNEQALILFTNRIRVLPLDEAAAKAYGALWNAVPQRRRNALDRWIAAHAISLDATLVTNNQDDFRDYPGLRLENWPANI